MLVDINKITVKDRVRKDFGDISELARDIQENGLINPPVVIPESDGTFTLLAGERRLRALKSLGKTDIEVRTWGKLTGEEALNIEISENEVRKDFSKAERIDYARRLERIESEKARERMSDGGKGRENFPTLQGRARDAVAEKMGIGSGRQYEKEKTIVDNKHLLDPSDFAEWDEGKLSTNKAYQKVKAELDAKNRLISDLQNRPPEIKEVVKQVTPPDYAEAKSKARSYDAETRRLKEKLQGLCDERNKLQEQIRELQEQTAREQYNDELLSGVMYFISQCGGFIRDVAGYVWIADKLADIPEKEREGYVRAASAVRDWSVALLQSIERNEEYGKPEIYKLIAESTKE